MYLQILVTPQHRDYQRILWRFSPNDPISVYRLNTVSFGISSSPYLAIRTLNELAERETETYPLASKIIKNHIYIDDILAGSTSLADALEVQKQLIALLKCGGFELRKWASNNQTLLSEIPEDYRQPSVSFDKEEPSFIKVLGLHWNPDKDSFSYKCQLNDKPCTKRNILSDIARIFDPLGFLSPITLLAKNLMQRLWESKTNWDEVPANSIVKVWRQLKQEMQLVSNLNIPRCIVPRNASRYDLHGFCDASTVGYAAVVFLRTESTHNTIDTYLIGAKSKVAPLKTLSIPRLELCGAVLLANLITFITSTYSQYITFDTITAWSDSQVVLAWLSSSPHKWKTFVANRVNHIQDILPSSIWKYIPSESNPADCASRGIMPQRLINHHMWWNGPPFLSIPRDEWHFDIDKCSHAETELEVQQEEKYLVHSSAVITNMVDRLLERFSSLTYIQRILGYTYRFIHNCRHPTDKHSGSLTSKELRASLMYLVKHVQTHNFGNLLEKIQKNQLLPKPFRRLALFMDRDGFLRVGGRIRNSNLPFSAKHPLLLPRSHRLTALIIEANHRKYLHPGSKTLHYLLLQQYWILSARRAIQETLAKCVQCFKVKPKSYTPFMGDLPFHRISSLKAFSYVSLDYCGPFFITMCRRRGLKANKAYVCVFVCNATKAVHLEVVSDLSAEAFIAAFRRFVARRGCVSHVYSDNATNFVGAHNIFIENARLAAQELEIQ
ncbi:uncharacterized protein LOC116163973 [Photinus pyralis]|uniref:uncharacterized protein LOC116163973 n=1 Tax=Photinus pyralis TaxID=7054 RepID=UPI00126722AD|nr:uncharacterized protein LOC116163973 [Photinus pyralis]